MTKVTIFLALGLIVAVSTTPLDFNKMNSITPQQLKSFKEELEVETKENNITCDNYKDTCAMGGKTTQDPNSVCQITLRSYLCDKLQDLKGIEEILARVKKVHPDAINPKAGREFEQKPEVKEAELEDDESGEDVEIE